MKGNQEIKEKNTMLLEKVDTFPKQVNNTKYPIVYTVGLYFTPCPTTNALTLRSVNLNCTEF